MKTIAQPQFKLWDIAAQNFPHTGTATEQLKFALQYAVLAPSSHNSQPWRFHVHDHVAELYADRTRACRVVDPEDRELIMSCGAALCYLRIVLQHFGYAGLVETFPNPADPDSLARVRLGFKGETSAAESALFHAIQKRHTNRQPFRDELVPTPALRALQAAAQQEGCWLHIVQDEADRYALADLIAEGDRLQWADAAFRRELAIWLHSNHNSRSDGMPGYVFEMNDLLSLAGPLVVRTFDLGEGQAAKDRDIAVYSPALVVLGTKNNTPPDWLAAGQAVARVLLQARIENVWASFLNQPIEVPALHPRLKSILRVDGVSQLILRLGFGEDVRPTPRRDMSEVLI